MQKLRFLTLPAISVVFAACSTANVTAAPANTAKTSNSSIEKTDRQSYFGKSHSAADKGGLHKHSDDGPRPYDPGADARAAIDNALAAARVKDKMTIVAMGANWCHDSRGLAAQFEKERFQTLLSENYELVYVDVGKKDRNIDIARDFGVNNIVGTPTVFVVASNGEVLNLDTAPTWRNADSRTEDEVFDYFEAFAEKSKT